jgi:hypothetical protein
MVCPHRSRTPVNRPTWWSMSSTAALSRVSLVRGSAGTFAPVHPRTAHPLRDGVIDAVHWFGGKDRAPPFTFANADARRDGGQRQELIAGRRGGDQAIDVTSAVEGGVPALTGCNLALPGGRGGVQAVEA